jgi:hypothetical protein
MEEEVHNPALSDLSQPEMAVPSSRRIRPLLDSLIGRYFQDGDSSLLARLHDELQDQKTSFVTVPSNAGYFRQISCNHGVESSVVLER